MTIKIWSAAAVLALTLTAGSAHASVGTPLIAAKATSATSTESAPKAAQKRYCVVDMVTGSRLPRKKCRTREEWLSTGFDPLAPKS